MAVKATKHKHWNEVVGLLLFAIGLLIMLSLVSYNATDPCFSVSGTGAGDSRSASSSGERANLARCAT